MTSSARMWSVIAQPTRRPEARSMTMARYWNFPAGDTSCRRRLHAHRRGSEVAADQVDCLRGGRVRDGGAVLAPLREPTETVGDMRNIAAFGRRLFQLKWTSLRSMETITWSKRGRPSVSRR